MPTTNPIEEPSAEIAALNLAEEVRRGTLAILAGQTKAIDVERIVDGRALLLRLEVPPPPSAELMLGRLARGAGSLGAAQALLGALACADVLRPMVARARDVLDLDAVASRRRFPREFARANAAAAKFGLELAALLVESISADDLSENGKG